jgi:hypothetical protein
MDLWATCVPKGDALLWSVTGKHCDIDSEEKRCPVVAVTTYAWTFEKREDNGAITKVKKLADARLSAYQNCIVFDRWHYLQ